MTETQRKWLTEYLGECWHNTSGGISEDMMSLKCGVCGKWLHIENIELCYQRTFTDLKDKQDLLEKVIEKGEWMEFCYYLWATLSVETFGSSFFTWLIQLPPIETAELICKWKVKY